MYVYIYTLRNKGAKWHHLGFLGGVPILELPKGATKNPFGGFFRKNPFKNPNIRFFERTLQGSSKS